MSWAHLEVPFPTIANIVSHDLGGAQIASDFISRDFESLGFRVTATVVAMPTLWSTDLETILIAISLAPFDFKSRGFIAISNRRDCDFAFWASKHSNFFRAHSFI